jgi:hypothetical protein
MVIGGVIWIGYRGVRHEEPSPERVPTECAREATELRRDDGEGFVAFDLDDVTILSDRLRIVRPFEVGPDEELSFVFDTDVVRKGQSGGYTLLPVIGKCGVVGEDVDIEEVGEGDGGTGTTDTAGGDDSAPTETGA